MANFTKRPSSQQIVYVWTYSVISQPLTKEPPPGCHGASLLSTEAWGFRIMPSCPPCGCLCGFPVVGPSSNSSRRLCLIAEKVQKRTKKEKRQKKTHRTSDGMPLPTAQVLLVPG